MEQDEEDFERKYRLDPDQEIVRDIIIDRFSDVDGIDPIQLLPADTGYGKSRVAAWVARFLFFNANMKVAIFCPKTLIPMWTNLMAAAGVPILIITTFDKLAGKKESGCKHPYLTRGKETTGPFAYTQAWIDVVTNPGVFIICDESQYVKNKTSARHWAFWTLAKTAVNLENAAVRILHLTASPIDKRENWECLFRNMGLVTGRLLLGPGGRDYENHALGWLFDHTRHLNPHAVAFIEANYPIKSAKVPDILAYLWKNVYQARATVPVTDPIYVHPVTGVEFVRSRANFFCTLDQEGISLAEEAMADLRDARIIRRNGDIDLAAAREQRNFGAIQKALVKLCHAKISSTARLALKHLRLRKKVIICCPFIADQDILKRMLALYRPLLLNGDPSINREQVVASFNSDDSDCMCLIMTPQIGGVGISLHDTTGLFPRCMLLLPTYDFLPIFQAFGRIYRRGLMSDTEAYIIYGNNTAAIEAILINSLAKTQVAESVLVPGSGRLFPGAYDFVIEDEGPQHLDLRTRLNRERDIARADMQQLQQNLL